MNKTLLTFLAFSLALITPALADSFNLTSYYPAPTGSYKTLRLTPQAALPSSNCAPGTLYSNLNDGSLPYLCAPDISNLPVFSAVSGPWTQASSYIYFTDQTNLTNKKVGIGTTSPLFKLTLLGDGGIFADSYSANFTHYPTQGSQAALMWFPSQSAFRVGYASGMSWYWDKVGNNSVAMGNENQAAVDASTIWGGSNNITQILILPTTGMPPASMIAGGLSNTTSGTGDQILGGQNNNATDYSLVSGKNNTAINYGVIGGGSDNNISGTTQNATISGGSSNTASGTAVTISGGNSNYAQYTDFNTVSGGYNNHVTVYGMIPTSYTAATVSGGSTNAASGDYSVVGGGKSNNAGGSYATISGGNGNLTNGDYATITGGNANTASLNSSIGGGDSNSASNSSTVIGGKLNASSGSQSIIVGGLSNSNAARYSLVAGNGMTLGAMGKNNFLFGYAPGGSAPTIIGSNKFIIYSEKMGIRDITPAALLEVNGNASTDDYLNLTAGPYTYTPVPGGVLKIKNNGFVGVNNSAPQYPLDFGGGVNAYVSPAGNFVNASSREYKENISDLDMSQAVETVKKLEPVQYNYKNEKDHRYLGFIAEDVPDLVVDKNRQGLAPLDIAAVLTKMVSHQQEVLRDQKAQTDDLLKEVEQLKIKARNRLRP